MYLLVSLQNYNTANGKKLFLEADIFDFSTYKVNTIKFTVVKFIP